MQHSTESRLFYDAPAALATRPREGLSNTYSFLSTREVVDALETDNWQVVEARQTRAKNPANNGHRKHEIILADRDMLKGGYNIFSEVPRVILSNSHDGGSAFKVEAGLWRTVCSNGLKVSDGVIQAVHIRHSRRTIEEVVQAAQAFRENASLISDHVERFKAVTLSTAEAYNFALQALHLRSGEYNTVGTFVAPQEILAAKRREDTGNDLWRVFNRTQEHLLKGGFPVYRLKTLDGNWQTRCAKAIRSIDESSKLNIGLWALAEQFSLN